jgi:hypothetical protein
MHAILLACATAATFAGLRADRPAKGYALSGSRLAWRNREVAPSTGRRRKVELPAFEMPPGRSLPRLECDCGASLLEAAKCRAEAKPRGSGTKACSAAPVTAPIPGTVASRRAGRSDCVATSSRWRMEVTEASVQRVPMRSAGRAAAGLPPSRAGVWRIAPPAPAARWAPPAGRRGRCRSPRPASASPPGPPRPKPGRHPWWRCGRCAWRGRRPPSRRSRGNPHPAG